MATFARLFGARVKRPCCHFEFLQKPEHLRHNERIQHRDSLRLPQQSKTPPPGRMREQSLVADESSTERQFGEIRKRTAD